MSGFPFPHSSCSNQGCGRKTIKKYRIYRVFDCFLFTALILFIDTMENFELLKNIFAIAVSATTLFWAMFRYFQKRDLQNAREVGEIIRDATAKAFQVSHIESRVREIEEIQAENTKAIQELGATLNKRLDQLFIAIANIKSQQ
jgi:hypothetical protein